MSEGGFSNLATFRMIKHIPPTDTAYSTAFKAALQESIPGSQCAPVSFEEALKVGHTLSRVLHGYIRGYANSKRKTLARHFINNSYAVHQHALGLIQAFSPEVSAFLTQGTVSPCPRSNNEQSTQTWLTIGTDIVLDCVFDTNLPTNRSELKKFGRILLQNNETRELIALDWLPHRKPVNLGAVEYYPEQVLRV